MGRLDGRVAIVTGAGSGIGAASARVLAYEGARVCCADLQLEHAELVAKEISDAGGTAVALRVDVADPGSNDELVRNVLEHFGRLDVAHLNAGVTLTAPVLHTAVEDFDRIMAVNLRGVFLGIQASARAMIPSGGGSIIVTSSGAGLLGQRGASAYCASKHGVIGLVRSAAADLSEHKIRVNTICPGVVNTPVLGPLYGNAELTQRVFGSVHPINRIGEPEEIGRVVAFLASDDASFVTAATYAVDGGVSSVWPGPDLSAFSRPRTTRADEDAT